MILTSFPTPSADTWIHNSIEYIHAWRAINRDTLLIWQELINKDVRTSTIFNTSNYVSSLRRYIYDPNT